MTLTRQQLLFDLYVAFYDARRGKSSRSYVRPYRTYISNHALHRIEKKVAHLDYSKPWRIIRSVNSYLGIFQHTDSYKLRCRLFRKPEILRIGIFNQDMTKIVDRKKVYGHIQSVNPKRINRR